MSSEAIMIPGMEGLPIAKIFHVAIWSTLMVAPVIPIRSLGFSLAPARGVNPLQLPFGVVQQFPDKSYGAIHVVRMLLGPIGASGSALAGYLARKSTALEAYPELYNIGANLLFYFGIINFIQHCQMCYERIVSKNILWKAPAVGLCFGFQFVYAAIVLRWIALMKRVKLPDANVMILGGYLHVAVLVLQNVVRLYFFSKNDFDVEKFDANFVQPTCPVLKMRKKTTKTK